MLESGFTGGFGNNRIILVNYRPSPPPQTKVVYVEDITDPSNSRILRRELSPSPAPSLVYGSPWDMTTPAGYLPVVPRPMFSVHNIPCRSASEVKEVADLRRLYVRAHNPDVGYSPLNKALIYRMPMPVYVDPRIPQNHYIGRGNLACLSFAAGRPISKRRRFYPDYDEKIRDEVIFRSFYSKLRDAANAGRNAGKRPIYQPIYYSKKTILGEENVPKRQPKESKWVERALANEKPPTPRPNKSAPVATETVVAPPRKESLKMQAPPVTPAPVKPVSVTLPGPRKSITEIIPEHVPHVENLPEESVTVKRPKEEPKPKEPSPPPREPTPPPKEPTPPPKEPSPPPKEPTPPPTEPTPPPKEPTPPPPKEPTPPPPKEPTPPPPAVVEEPAPTPSQEPAAAPVAEETPAAEAPAESPPSAQEAAESGSEPISDPSAQAAGASEQITGDEASNKGEVEDIQLDEEITLDEVCDVEENDLEIESDDPETNQSAAAPVESPQETAGSAETVKVENEPVAASPAVESVSEASIASPETPAAQEPANDQDAESPAPVSIVVADIDGPLPPDEEAPAVQEEPLTVEQIQAEAERRREEFAQLLEEHAELVTTVTKLEKVAVIVSKSCAEAIAQQESEQQPPKTTS